MLNPAAHFFSGRYSPRREGFSGPAAATSAAHDSPAHARPQVARREIRRRETRVRPGRARWRRVIAATVPTGCNSRSPRVKVNAVAHGWYGSAARRTASRADLHIAHGRGRADGDFLDKDTRDSEFALQAPEAGRYTGACGEQPHEQPSDLNLVLHATLVPALPARRGRAVLEQRGHAGALLMQTFRQ